MSDMTDELPTQDQVDYITGQVDELTRLGATVRALLQPLPPGVIGLLTQVLPDGPMTVMVDPTKTLVRQSLFFVMALEFILVEPEAEWEITDTVNPDGTPLRFRTIRIRVEE
jgi:hypothetical protein